MFGRVKCLYRVNISMPNSEDSFPELMYKPPGSEVYKNLTDVLDEIHIRLDEIDENLKKLEQN